MTSESAGGDPWLDTVSSDARGLQRWLDRVIDLADQDGASDALADALRDLSIAARRVGESVTRTLAATAQRSTTDLSDMRVLLVSDDDDARAVLGMRLGLDGIDVVEAADPASAVAAAADDRGIEVVLTDLHLPGSSGLGLVESIHQLADHRETPVVIHTHDPSAHVAEEALEAGAADFIRKPVPAAEVAARLRRVVTTSRRQRQTTEDMHRLETLVDTDELTGLPNRRALADAYGTSGRGVALLLVDVDRFKQVNDRHGHDVGDEVLRQVADVLRTEKRSDDVAGRWGGDEFMVVARNIDLDGLRHLAHRLVGSVRERWATSASVTVGITVSVGAALGTAETSAADLFEQADRALYAAKHAGRNRAVVTD